MSNASSGSPNQHSSFPSPAPNTTTKKKRNLPGNPDPDAEVIALSPKSLMAINRFMCEVCNKGFQRDQNLQLHRRGHNLPWKLKQRSTGKDVAVRKKAYVCPEASCVHHHPSRALGDLTGIKKHFSRKHGEKKYKCDKCSKKYAVHSDWKAHSKTCGTREYKCDCGTIFSRRDSFITHRAFCDALAEESVPKSNPYGHHPLFSSSSSCHDPSFSTVLLPKELGTEQHYFNNINAWLPTSIGHNTTAASNINYYSSPVLETSSAHHENTPLPLASSYQQASAAAANSSAHLSATALLQKAAQMGAAMSQKNAQIMAPHSISAPTTNVGSRNEEGGGGDGLTRDFLGLRALSHKDILSMAAAGACLPCMSSPSTFDQHCQHNNNNITKPWHG